MGLSEQFRSSDRVVIGLEVHAQLADRACGCQISRCTYFDRKHYFYPDLPQGYQVSQLYTPIGQGGQVAFRRPEGPEAVAMYRIHLEEDAGKSMHREEYTLADFNYFPEPDLVPLRIIQDWLDQVYESLPPLPARLYSTFTQQYGLSDYDAQLGTEDKETTQYFSYASEHD